jgi:hypothetical protein
MLYTLSDLFSLPPPHSQHLIQISHTMSNNVDWDSKVVIGHKAKAPKVTRNAADLNGKSPIKSNHVTLKLMFLHSRELFHPFFFFEYLSFVSP